VKAILFVLSSSYQVKWRKYSGRRLVVGGGHKLHFLKEFNHKRTVSCNPSSHHLLPCQSSANLAWVLSVLLSLVRHCKCCQIAFPTNARWVSPPAAKCTQLNSHVHPEKIEAFALPRRASVWYYS